MGTKAVELGSGYGSSSRYLAVNFGATVDCVDLSQEANDLNRRLTEEAGLSHVVKVWRKVETYNVCVFVCVCVLFSGGGGWGGVYGLIYGGRPPEEKLNCRAKRKRLLAGSPGPQTHTHTHASMQK